LSSRSTLTKKKAVDCTSTGLSISTIYNYVKLVLVYVERKIVHQPITYNVFAFETMVKEKINQDDEKGKDKGVEQMQQSLVTATDATNSQRSSPSSRRSSPRLVPDSVGKKKKVPSKITPSSQLFHDGVSSITDTPSKSSGSKKRKVSTPGSASTKSSKTSKALRSPTQPVKKKSAKGRPKTTEDDPYETDDDEQETPSEETEEVEDLECLQTLTDLEKHSIDEMGDEKSLVVLTSKEHSRAKAWKTGYFKDVEIKDFVKAVINKSMACKMGGTYLHVLFMFLSKLSSQFSFSLFSLPRYQEDT
jgi:hypothetical protein